MWLPRCGVIDTIQWYIPSQWTTGVLIQEQEYGSIHTCSCQHSYIFKESQDENKNHTCSLFWTENLNPCFCTIIPHTNACNWGYVLLLPLHDQGPVYSCCMFTHVLQEQLHEFPSVNSLAPVRSGYILKNIIFNLVLLINMFRSSNGNVLRWMSHDFTDDMSTLVQVMAWCRQATSHYLSQCWLRSLSPYDVTGPQWVNKLNGMSKTVILNYTDTLKVWNRC